MAHRAKCKVDSGQWKVDSGARQGYAECRSPSTPPNGAQCRARRGSLEIEADNSRSKQTAAQRWHGAADQSHWQVEQAIIKI
jgi:hypothetical protein